jgi:queuine/archaeosine tRNA-ribosyltransferase
MVEFYADGGFTHGCSVDHLIFDFDDEPARTAREVPAATRARYQMTLALAADFWRESKKVGRHFTPLGVVQGWSAASMASAAAKLSKMGYTYLAVGGLVPLYEHQIHRALAAIRAAVPSKVRLHLLGFGKIERLHEYAPYGIASFDTTSPLLRAFKDARRNYFALNRSGGLDYYTAIRVPQVTRNTKLKHRALEGRLDQEHALGMERAALDSLRSYERRRTKLNVALDKVIAYWEALKWSHQPSNSKRERARVVQRELYRRTLEDRPWEACACRTCREGGIESVIFRSSNRNKRRGIHNLHVFYKHLTKARAAA